MEDILTDHLSVVDGAIVNRSGAKVKAPVGFAYNEDRKLVPTVEQPAPFREPPESLPLAAQLEFWKSRGLVWRLETRALRWALREQVPEGIIDFCLKIDTRPRDEIAGALEVSLSTFRRRVNELEARLAVWLSELIEEETL
jgi:hypothetical protein